MKKDLASRRLRGRENLSQANKLSRTYAVLLDALNRHRGKGQQKVTVERTSKRLYCGIASMPTL